MYGISDFCFLLIYYVIGYRKKVVYTNLKNSFPEKTHEEIKKIERKFYRYLCDLFLETFKTLTIGKKQLLKRVQFSDKATAIYNTLRAENRSSIMVLGHYGNWEICGAAFSCYVPEQVRVIYHPITNKQFDGLMYKMRSKAGTKLIAMKDTLREMVRTRNELTVTAFIADQTPPPESAYWTTFLNQETPVFWGTEKIAQKLNFAVVYVTINRPKRGLYVVESELIFNQPKNTIEGEISEKHTQLLERDIKNCPEIWLWSHRRWKHKKPRTE